MVSRDGSVEWWCPARFDAPTVFARLLDPRGGHFSIRPPGEWDVTWRYRPDTFVLETRWTNAVAEVVVTDLLALEAGARGHQIGIASPGLLVRAVECVRGDAALDVELIPRFDYARAAPPSVEEGERTLRFTSGTELLELAGDIRALDVDAAAGSCRATLRLHAGQRRALMLRTEEHASWPSDVGTCIADTVEAWRSWAASHSYDGWGRDAVQRSSLLLQALTYGPTGAVVAAPTTSLPEIVGGSANWDYRYAWLRDASIVLRALWVGTCVDEAHRYFAWMADAAHGDHGTPVVFRVDGGRDVVETTLTTLAGWRSSRPVRVGNEASSQRQLDIPGHVLDAAHTLVHELGDMDGVTRAFLLDLADNAAAHWRKTDSGIWEGREGEQHYTSSKVMCWVALDRAVRMRAVLGADDRRVAHWSSEMMLLHDTIVSEAWSNELGAFAGWFGSDELDASVLLMPIMGFLDATDPRMAATVDAIESQLGEHGLVRRWTGARDDAFVMCACWLAECRALAGDIDHATQIFERITSHANDLGLLAEEIDLESGELLGNYPQALSHAALICAAASIDRARRSAVE